MSARRPAGRPAESDGGGVGAWLPALGGVALGAGLIGLLYKLFLSGKPKCPTIDPKKRRWPKQDKTSWFSR